MAETAGRKTLDEAAYQAEREDDRLEAEATALVAATAARTTEAATITAAIASIDATLAETDPDPDDGDPSATELTAKRDVLTARAAALTAAQAVDDERAAAIVARRAALAAAIADTETAVALLAPAPRLDEVRPACVDVRGGSVSLTLLGAGFTADMTARIDGVDADTNFISSSEASVALPEADEPASFSVSVFVPEPGGGTSVGFTVRAVNPAPTAWRVSPTELTAHTGTVALSVHGVGFTPESVVEIDGEERPTTFISGAELTTTAEAGKPRTATVVVRNPAPGGGTSESVALPTVSA